MEIVLGKWKEELAFTFDCLVERVTREGLVAWTDAESSFLRVVELLDDPSRLRRGFEAVLVGLLEDRTSKALARPTDVDSTIFGLSEVDFCHLARGGPRAGASVVAMSTSGPKLRSRVREIAFESIDIKAANSRPSTIRSVGNWIQNTEPAYFSFWAVRVEDQKDFESVRSILVGLSRYCNGVGAIIYEPAPSSTQKAIKYRPKKVPELGMDQALRQMAQFMT